MVRPTYALIDLQAIRHNVAAISEFMAPTQYCAVVKADGYGHGDVPVASAALDAGASRLAVALVEEGIRLREAGIDAPILVLSQPDIASATEIVHWDLTPTVYTADFASALKVEGFGGGVHVKVDTGMHRVGVAANRFDELMESMHREQIRVEAVFTHFPVADTDLDFTRSQIDLFDELVAKHDVPLAHLANTPGALLFPEANRDFSRIGLGTYGLHPCDATRELVDLRPAMSVVSHVSHVQRLAAGSRPSYGRRQPLGSDSTVVTVPIGYADGYPRLLSGKGRALIHGASYPLVGTVTMDQAMVAVGDAELAVGDEVVLMGSRGGEVIGADEWATKIGTISYEIVCSIGPRVPRRYLNE